MVGLLILGLLGGIGNIWRAGTGTLPVAGQAPNFTATDVTGKTVSLSSLHGKIILMTWYYTHCTDECPLTMYRFEQIQNELIKQHEFGKRVLLIAMTLDPTRDTVPVIEKCGQHFNANLSGWYLLRTSLQKTDAILRAWGIQAKPSSNKEFIEHIS
jgi:protein SCO1/2